MTIDILGNGVAFQVDAKGNLVEGFIDSFSSADQKVLKKK